MTQDESPASAGRAAFKPGVLLAALLGAALVWISTPGGVGASPDAWNYFAAARNLLAGEGFTRYTGEPFVLWPPLFPTLIAALLGLGDLAGQNLHLLDALRLVNMVTVAVAVVAANALLRRLLWSVWLAALATLAVALSYPLIYVAAFAWSEPLFILLCLGFLVTLDRARQGFTARTTGMAAVLAALASLQRYTGMVLIPLGGLWLLTAPAIPFWPRLRRAFSFAVAAALPLALWLAYNRARAGTFTGERNPSAHPLHANLRAVYNLTLAWLTPESLIPDYRLAGLIVAGALSGAALALIVRRRGETLAALGTLRWLPLALFGAFYAGFVVISASRVQFDPIDERLLAPLYPAVIGLAFVALDRALAWARAHTGGRAAFWLAGALATLWLLHPIGRLESNLSTLQDISRASQSTYEMWRRSDLMRTVRAHPPAGNVLTNAPLHLLVHTGVPVRAVPETLDGWEALVREAEGRPLTIVWFEPIARCDWGRRHCVSTDYTVEMLAAQFALTRVTVTYDGGVYSISPAKARVGVPEHADAALISILPLGEAARGPYHRPPVNLCNCFATRCPPDPARGSVGSSAVS